MSNFGNHPDVGSLTLPVYFYFQLCEKTAKAGDDPNSAGFPPRPIDPGTGRMQRWEPPFILMTFRGGCTFATKARHAQHAGASAIIIADDTCLCGDAQCMVNDTLNGGACQDYEPVMADDGSGGDVSIPGFLLYRDDALPIKETIADQKTSVLMSIRWQKPKVDTIKFGLWTDMLEDEWIDNVGPIVNALGDRGHFHPHYVLHNGTRTNCGGGGSVSLCPNMCTNNGRYCYPTHDRNGTAVVLEVLRRACIRKHHGPSSKGEGVGVGSKWWEYASHYRDVCGRNVVDDGKCAHEALRRASISKDDIDGCMTDSGDPTRDEINVLLDEVLRSQIEYGVTLSPRLVVNDRAMKDPSAKSLLEEICDSTSGLDLCDRCRSHEDPVACVRKRYAVEEAHHSSFFRRTLRFLITIGLLVSVAYFVKEAYKGYVLHGGGGTGASPVPSSMAYSILQDRGGDDFAPLGGVPN